MSENKHPGAPWKRSKDRALSWIYIEDEADEVVCKVWCGAPDDEEAQAAGEADARLILAAPELLAELKHAACLVRAMQRAAPTQAEFHSLEAVASAYEAVIAKATGP